MWDIKWQEDESFVILPFTNTELASPNSLATSWYDRPSITVSAELLPSSLLVADKGDVVSAMKQMQLTEFLNSSESNKESGVEMKMTQSESVITVVSESGNVGEELEESAGYTSNTTEAPAVCMTITGNVGGNFDINWRSVWIEIEGVIVVATLCVRSEFYADYLPIFSHLLTSMKLVKMN